MSSSIGGGGSVEERVPECHGVEIGEMLGRGGFSMVYKGKWQDTEIAAKCIHTGGLPEQNESTGLMSEAQMLHRLRHPNIITFYGIYTDKHTNRLYLIMECAHGGSLRDYLDNMMNPLEKKSLIDLPTFIRTCAIPYARQIALAMAYLHEGNLAVDHGDLKSENILISGNLVKLTDFGLCRASRTASISANPHRNASEADRIKDPLHGTQNFIGTVSYAAPECLGLYKGRYYHMGEKSDVFSLGILMAELLTGEYPYEKTHTPRAVAEAIRIGVRPKLPTNLSSALLVLIGLSWSHLFTERRPFREIANILRRFPIDPYIEPDLASTDFHLPDIDTFLRHLSAEDIYYLDSHYLGQLCHRLQFPVLANYLMHSPSRAHHGLLVKMHPHNSTTTNSTIDMTEFQRHSALYPNSGLARFSRGDETVDSLEAAFNQRLGQAITGNAYPPSRARHVSSGIQTQTRFESILELNTHTPSQFNTQPHAPLHPNPVQSHPPAPTYPLQEYNVNFNSAPNWQNHSPAPFLDPSNPHMQPTHPPYYDHPQPIGSMPTTPTSILASTAPPLQLSYVHFSQTSQQSQPIFYPTPNPTYPEHQAIHLAPGYDAFSHPPQPQQPQYPYIQHQTLPQPEYQHSQHFQNPQQHHAFQPQYQSPQPDYNLSQPLLPSQLQTQVQHQPAQYVPYGMDPARTPVLTNMDTGNIQQNVPSTIHIPFDAVHQPQIVPSETVWTRIYDAVKLIDQQDFHSAIALLAKIGADGGPVHLLSNVLLGVVIDLAPETSSFSPYDGLQMATSSLFERRDTDEQRQFEHAYALVSDCRTRSPLHTDEGLLYLWLIIESRLLAEWDPSHQRVKEIRDISQGWVNTDYLWLPKVAKVNSALRSKLIYASEIATNDKPWVKAWKAYFMISDLPSANERTDLWEPIADFAWKGHPLFLTLLQERLHRVPSSLTQNILFISDINGLRTFADAISWDL